MKNQTSNKMNKATEASKKTSSENMEVEVDEFELDSGNSCGCGCNSSKIKY